MKPLSAALVSLLAALGAACTSGSGIEAERSTPQPTSTTIQTTAAVSTTIPRPTLVIAILDFGEPNEFTTSLVTEIESAASAADLSTAVVALPSDDGRDQWRSLLTSATSPGDLVVTNALVRGDQAGELLPVLAELGTPTVSILTPFVPEHPALIGTVYHESLFEVLAGRVEALSATSVLCLATGSGVTPCEDPSWQAVSTASAYVDMRTGEVDFAGVPELRFDAILSDAPLEATLHARTELGGDRIGLVTAQPADGVSNALWPAPVQPAIAAAVVALAQDHLDGMASSFQRRELFYEILGTARIDGASRPLPVLPVTIAASVAPLGLECSEGLRPFSIDQPSAELDLDGNGSDERLILDEAAGVVQINVDGRSIDWPTLGEPLVVDLDDDGLIELISDDGIHHLHGCDLRRHDLTGVRALFGLEPGTAIPARPFGCVEHDRGRGLFLGDAVLELADDTWTLRSAGGVEPTPCGDDFVAFGVG